MPADAAPPVRFVPVGVKVALGVLIVLGAVVSAVSIVLVQRAHDDVVASKAVAAQMVTDLFAASVAPALDFDDAEGLQGEIKKLASNSEVSFAAVWKAGGAKPGAILSRGGDRAGDEPEGADTRTLPDRVETWRPVRNPGGKAIGSVEVHFSLARENESFATAKREIVAAAAAVGLLLFTLVFGLVRVAVTGPLKRLSLAVQGVEEGRFERVRAREDDEIGQLGVAYNRMTSAIADRELRLATLNARLQELFDHLRQAIIVFGPDGQLEPLRSRSAEQLFGSRLEQGDAHRLLYDRDESVEAAAFEEWLKVAFEVPPDEWQEIIDLAPRRAVLRRAESDERILALEFRPIVEEGKVVRVMLLASDETDKLRLERQVVEQEHEHARQMKAMKRLVAGGGQLLVNVIEGAREHLRATRDLLAGAEGNLGRKPIDRLFSHVHTIKGEARAFDLSVVETRAASLEDRLAILRGRARTDEPINVVDARRELAPSLAGLESAIDGAATMLVEASPIGAAILEQVTVRRDDLEKLVGSVAARGGDLAQQVGRLASRPFGESVLYLVDAVPLWADREGKQAVVEVDGRNVRIPRDLARVLPGVLTHLARNSVAHGIELPEDRVKAGKAQVGVVELSAIEGVEGPVIVFRDDGAGLDAEQVTARARASGHDLASPSELVFVPGLSTAEAADELAGRGVGLSAVREELGRVGYGVRIDPDGKPGVRVVIAPQPQGG